MFEKQAQTQNATVEELKRQLALQRSSAAKQLQEVIESQKTEMQRQSVVYERQVEAIRQEMNRVRENEKQRVASIKAKVRKALHRNDKMTTAQNDLQTLTRTFRISTPV